MLTFQVMAACSTLWWNHTECGLHIVWRLRSIVKESLLSPGLSLSQASRQFHEQLSVRLWQYNSRMISDRLDLVIVDYLPNYCDIAT